ncbi:MAG: methonine synthase [Candidatus Altiarchaeota archaeon]
MAFLVDDIGSFPLPQDLEREWIDGLGGKIALGESAKDEELFKEVVEESFRKKIASGLDVVTFPQFRDMISSFMDVIDGFYEEDHPWVVKKDKAVLPELRYLEAPAKEHFEKTGEKVKLRVCVTGPLELHFASVGPLVDGGLLRNLSESVGRFLANSITNTKYIETSTVSIDEPGLGFQPNMVLDDEDLVAAWMSAVKPAKNLDVQLHLHSSVSVDRVFDVAGINVIGVESAEDPKNLEAFDKKQLENEDKFLRVGVARTNIFGLASDYKLKTGVDVWKDKGKLGKLVNELESPKIIKKRIKKATDSFGDRIKYIGPDCGLSAWPTQESAVQLLKNTVKAAHQ